jgi:dTDP-4-amino-4,6-dideoxygalactose transaminase
MTTHDAALAERLKLLRGHGMQPRYYHHLVGINSRLDTLQAAVLNVKLPYLDDWTAGQTNARLYGDFFAEHGLERILGLPQARTAVTCESIRDSRSGWSPHAARALCSKNRHRNPIRCHCTGKSASAPGLCPAACRTANEPPTTIALPIFPELSAAELRTVVQGIAAFFGVARHPWRIAPFVKTCAQHKSPLVVLAQAHSRLRACSVTLLR